MDQDLLERSDQGEKSVADAVPPAERERVVLQEFAVDGVPSAGQSSMLRVVMVALDAVPAFVPAFDVAVDEGGVASWTRPVTC